ncbi:DUF2271 domain-containing protein [Tenacibaculum sp. M341]|uniref:DUF2271 domain-containing protein n=1 Tax=Tenacibaculum sp. M341 TaxID=2530339 RepID=UPI00104C9BD5|nr:DUF2271 domain-containing protein [Tenacibaculum sp. M341]TCI93510.1 DUF2271 domain-containing protein [Tenacibaculum sp. M341]
MNRLKKILFLVTICTVAFAFTTNNSSKYKCMIQLKNYDGEGAYIIVSLLNAEGAYQETLQVLGDDDEWYHEVYDWWDFYGKKRNDIDAITGETISGGQRAIKVIEIPNDKMNADYKIRFETAVEDQEYYADDVEFDLTSENVKNKFEGKGFIRYVRMMPQK